MERMKNETDPYLAQFCYKIELIVLCLKKICNKNLGCLNTYALG